MFDQTKEVTLVGTVKEFQWTNPHVILWVLRRTGPRGVSMRATGAWELPALHEAWETGGLDAVAELMAAPGGYTEQAITGAAASVAMHAGRIVAG